uniref:Uncharacterized protein n=1 Tax=Moniliophthora roreri TaxID=221103 RepID=A0A0W0G8Q3_MONRR
MQPQPQNYNPSLGLGFDSGPSPGDIARVQAQAGVNGAFGNAATDIFLNNVLVVLIVHFHLDT